MNHSRAYVWTPSALIRRLFATVAWLIFLLSSAMVSATATAQTTSNPPLPIFKDASGYTVVFPRAPAGFDEGASVPAANIVFSKMTGDAQRIKVCGASRGDQPLCFKSAKIAAGASSTEVTGIPDYYSGSQIILLRNDKENIATVSVILSPLTPDEVTIAAALATLLLFVIVVVLASKTKLVQADGARRSLFSIFVLDSDSNTYSLSKFQLYAWLTVTVFGYIYLFVSRFFVQEIISIPDVQLPIPSQSSLSVTGAISLSVGTVVIATGTSSIMGGKGGGEQRPRWSDLVTSGGVVASERVQFLVWTIVAIISYIMIVLAENPATITTLPVIPPELLALSGVSAAGYLAGKIARGPGPQIKALTAKVPGDRGSELTIDIDGSALATKGSAFFVADITNSPQGATEVPVQPIYKAGSDIDPASGIATHLVLGVAQPAGIVWTRSHTYRFTVINPDGERASWNFSPT